MRQHQNEAVLFLSKLSKNIHVNNNVLSDYVRIIDHILELDTKTENQLKVSLSVLDFTLFDDYPILLSKIKELAK